MPLIDVNSCMCNKFLFVLFRFVSFRFAEYRKPTLKPSGIKTGRIKIDKLTDKNKIFVKKKKKD